MLFRIDDISKNVMMERLMVQSEKMLSVGGLAAGMAHEINNPLAGIIQNANVLSNRMWKSIEMPANQNAAKEIGLDLNLIKEYMEKREIPRMINAIKMSSQRIAEIVENILSFARKSDDIKTEFSLKDIIEDVLKISETEYDVEKNMDFKLIKINKNIHDNIPNVLCDKSQIQQVLLNLLRNASQAMQKANSKNPEITINLFFDKVINYINLVVEDNGPGMDKETSKRIFEPFFTTKSTGEGTGLGLSVSYFIISENHGWDLSVDSQPGRGTKFIIKIPVTQTLHNH